MAKRPAPVLERSATEVAETPSAHDMVTLRHATVLGILSGLATATQLRAAGSAGIFDVLIIAYAVAVLLKHRRPVSFLQSAAGLFLLGFIVVGATGGLLSVLTRDTSTLRVVLGLLPYVFATFGLEMASSQRRPALYLQRWLLCHGVVVVGSQLLLLAAFRLGLDSIGPVELFVGDRERKTRFLGWTNNPNQLAMAATIGAAAIGMSKTRVWLTAAGMAGGLIIGLATLSDGFRVALAVSAGVFLLTVISGRLQVSRGWVATARVAAIAFGLFVALNAGSLFNSVMTTADDGDQAVERIELWSSCSDAVVRSPLVGLGPGSHGELDGEERSCHNTFVEAATFAGVPMVLLLLGMSARLFIIQVNRSELIGLWFVVHASTQMVFSFFFRYPQLWMLFLALQVGAIAHERQSKSVGHG